MAKVIGITGGIGSGKTTVCKVFRLLGIPVFEADAVARELMDEDEDIKKSMRAEFGEFVYTADGKLNREVVAAAIFKNNELREKVNRLVHPAVHKAFFRWREQHEDFPYLVYEAAILLEGGFQNQMDYIILITAPAEQRVARVMKRNGMTEKMVWERINSQMPDEEKRKLADHCIDNDDNNLILPEIIRIDKKLKTDGTIW